MRPTHAKIENGEEVVRRVAEFQKNLDKFYHLISEVNNLRKSNKKLRTEVKLSFSKIEFIIDAMVSDLPGSGISAKHVEREVPKKIQKLQKKVKVIEETVKKIEKKPEHKKPEKKEEPKHEKPEHHEEPKPEKKTEEKERPVSDEELVVPVAQREDEPMTKEALEYIERIKRLRKEFEKIKEEI